MIQAGVVDLEGGFTANLGGGAVAAFMGGSPKDLPDAYAQASPIARVPLNVPTVCVHGRQDDVVPIGQSEVFVAAAQRAGDVSELQAFDGDHSALIDTDHPGLGAVRRGAAAPALRARVTRSGPRARRPGRSGDRC